MLSVLELTFFSLTFWASLSSAQIRSWLACPPSFDMSLTRAGNTNAPCENVDFLKLAGYEINAGARLKVGWSSGNRGGGFVRLALVPSHQVSEASFNASVLRQTCFGYDNRPGRFAFGNCVHPCNARGGCEFRNQTADNQRYDTTITVPTNLADGDYILQMMAVAGNSRLPIYSCSKLKVFGGNPDQSCSVPNQIPMEINCIKAGSPDYRALLTDSKPGTFCYDSDGSSDIDSNIKDVPLNVDCDPRISCALSVNPGLCAVDFPSVLDPEANPRQSCTNKPTPSPFSSTGIKTKSSTSSTTSSTTSTTTTKTRSFEKTSVYVTTTDIVSTPFDDVTSTRSSGPEPTCLTQGKISNLDYFCQVWSDMCHARCLAKTSRAAEVNECASRSSSAFGVDLKCRCSNGRDITDLLIPNLIPGGCLS